MTAADAASIARAGLPDTARQFWPFAWYVRRLESAETLTRAGLGAYVYSHQTAAGSVYRSPDGSIMAQVNSTSIKLY